MKRVLIYIGHPAQYHFFRNALSILKHDGHEIKILIKTKDVLEDLLKNDGWDYTNIQTVPRKNTKLSILKAALSRTLTVCKIAQIFHADMLMGTDSSIAQAAWLLRKPSFTTLEDDVEIIKYLAKLTYPFTSHIVVPNVCRVGKWENKKIGYDGYMKLAYLHPKYFKANEDVVKQYGITDYYIILRLAKLTAHHDKGIRGLNESLVSNIISSAQTHGVKVYISSEIQLNPIFEPYRLRINPKDIHHIMAFATMLISDSQSMSVESAMLGVPSLRFSDFAGQISVLEELEYKYQLTFGIPTSEPDKLIEKMNQLLDEKGLKNEFNDRHKKMLEDKIDVTEFIVKLVEQYPFSVKQIKSNNDKTINSNRGKTADN